jgi:hypothetical protein
MSFPFFNITHARARAEKRKKERIEDDDDNDDGNEGNFVLFFIFLFFVFRLRLSSYFLSSSSCSSVRSKQFLENLYEWK